MDEAKYFYAMTSEHDVHRGFVTFRNALQKHLVRDIFFYNATISLPIVLRTPRKMRWLVNGISQFTIAHRIGLPA